MSALQHHEAKDLFSAYVDQELPVGELEQLVHHLEGCENCQHALDQFEDTMAQVRGLPKLAAPAQFSRQVMRRVKHRQRRAAALRPLLDGPLRVPVEAALPILLAAAVFALLLYTVQ